MQRKFFSCGAIGILLLVAACTSAPLINMTNVAVPCNAAGKTLTSDEVRDAIIAACKKRGWVPTITVPSHQIRATLNTRGHQAVVDIDFSPKDYSISYVSSNKLNYRDGKIHRNYDRWVKTLSNSIQKNLNKQQ